MVKAMLIDKMYLTTISNAFERDLFENDTVGKIFEFSKQHIEQFKTLPPREAIVNSIESVDEVIREANAIDFDVAGNYEYLIDQSNYYLKDQAIKRALMQSVDIIESRDERELIRKNVEDALCKDLKQDLGLAYFKQLGERLKRIFEATEQNRVRSYFPEFDEIINGGFPPFTLSVLVAKIHGFKSNTMANFAARQVLNGHIVVMLTLEMSEDMFAQRFDAIYSLIDINRMYLGDNKRALFNRLKEKKESPNRGELYIKQFPTGAATVNDFRKYIRELKMRGIEPDIVYVDYINLMKSTLKKHDNLYTSVKSIAEELRAQSFEFKIPYVSVSQLNREGSFVGFDEIDFNYIAESMGLPATADFMAILGTDEDAMVYESELACKIVKNRLGGRVGEMWTSYYDTRSLKMYDGSELEEWMADKEITGDSRDAHHARPRQQQGRQRGRR